MKLINVFLVIIITLSLASCQDTESNKASVGIEITDAYGNVSILNESSRIVSGYASFAECWQLAGGKLVGVTEDAVTEHGLTFEENPEIIGTVKNIDIERVVALKPDYVILSADIAGHIALKDSLESMGIPHGFFRVDFFEDYKSLMAQFCNITGREDLFDKNVLEVEKRIEEIKSDLVSDGKSFLLLRAYSTGMKAKADDNFVGLILKESGLENIADDGLLEDLSLEYIIKRNPDYIFALTMGNTDSALSYLAENIQNNPAWQNLSAVKSGNYHLLPKELFHYKPNNRWDKSYEYIAKLIKE